MPVSCEFDSMEYMDEQSVDSNLVCNICTKPFKDPVCTPCDHTFGRVCITEWLEKSRKDSCPICVHKPISVSDMTQASRPLRNMLDGIRVRCTLCDQTNLQRGNFVDHITKVCPKAMVECQAADIKCPWKGPRDELETHKHVCVFEPLRPVLASLIAENRQLLDQVKKHDQEIKQLSEKISEINHQANNDSDDQSDASSVAESSISGAYEKEEDTIFIRNLPANIKPNNVFDFFSQIGRIKFNPRTQKADLFIFQTSNKNGLCNAKVAYVDKSSANAAVAEYNYKHIPQWNTRIGVEISKAKSKRNVQNPEEIIRSKDQATRQATAVSYPEKLEQKGPSIPSLVNEQEPVIVTQVPKQPRKRSKKRPPVNN